MRSVTNEEAHRLAREKGVSRPLYAIVRVLVTPFMRLYFRMHIAGAEHIPGEGAAIVAPNPGGSAPSAPAPPGHPRITRLYLCASWPRPSWSTRATAGCWYASAPSRCAAASRTPTLSRPRSRCCVRVACWRCSPRARACATPRVSARRGAAPARIALEAGAPLVPCAITGTDELFFGPFLKPRRVQVAFSEPIPVHHLTSTPEVAGELVEESLWPQVEGEYRRLRARPTLVAGALAALGRGRGAAGSPPPALTGFRGVRDRD